MILYSIAGSFGQVQIVAGKCSVVLDVQGAHHDTFGELRRDHGLVALPLSGARELHEQLGLAIGHAAIGSGPSATQKPTQSMKKAAALAAGVALACLIGAAFPNPARASSDGDDIPVPLVVRLAASCKVPGVPVQRIAAAAQAESGRNPLAIHDNATGEVLHPATRPDAIALAARLIAAGHRPDLGLMQINAPANLARTGLTVETAFDAQANVCAGAVILAEDYAAERRVSCRYNTGHPECQNGYPARIEHAMAQLSAQPAIAEAQEIPAESAACAAPEWDVEARMACAEQQQISAKVDGAKPGGVNDASRGITK